MIGRGWHRAAGLPHAEIEALCSLRRPELAHGATLYVTLEPCSTSGRTPPCTKALIGSGVGRVVYGARDPNPKHAGRADKILRSAGIQVTPGILAPECEAMNEAWNKWIATGLPFVTAKAGMSLDGCIASPPGTRWITSSESRADAMKLRAACDAVLVGGGTVRADNPRLTVRGIPCTKQPLRAVWTRSGNLPEKSRLFTDAHAARTRVYQGISLRSCLRKLAREGVQTLLIEGGGHLLGESFDRGLVDRAVFYMAPVLIGGAVPAVGGKGAADPSEAYQLEDPDYRRIGPDLRISGKVQRRAKGSKRRLRPV